MKTALAPTAHLATPKVESFVKTKLIPRLGGELKELYLCDPSTSDVFNLERTEEWVEANWGAHVIMDSFSVGEMFDLQRLSDTIGLNEATVRAVTNQNKIEVTFWLTARVMRH